MDIFLNQKIFSVINDISITNLLKEVDVDSKYIAIEVNGEIKYYSVTGSAGSHISRGFCKNCGSPLISFVEENPSIKFIKAGSLDDSSWVSADSNFFSSSASPWSPVDEDIHTFTHNPDFA